MERNSLFFIAVIAMHFVATSASSQYVQYGTSLDTPTDSRSVALGESFVALPRNHAGMIYNQAAIANITGVVFSYERRNSNVLDIEGRNIWALSAAFQVPYVDVGIFYRRFNVGELGVSTPAFPEGTGQTVNPHDISYGLTIAREFDQHWNAGISIKSENMSGLYNLTPSSFSSSVSKPILFDLGILFTHEFPISEGNESHSLNIGMAFQNIGGDPEVTPRYSIPPPPNAVRLENAIELARYFRIGLSHELNVNASSTEMVRPFRFVGTGEFRTITNSNYRSFKDFWGFGMEATLFDVAVFRVGGYGASAITTMRYGLGLRAPVQRFGAEVPLIVCVDYAAVPQNVLIFGFDDRKVLHIYLPQCSV